MVPIGRARSTGPAPVHASACGAHRRAERLHIDTFERCGAPTTTWFGGLSRGAHVPAPTRSGHEGAVPGGAG